MSARRASLALLLLLACSGGNDDDPAPTDDAPTLTDTPIPTGDTGATTATTHSGATEPLTGTAALRMDDKAGLVAWLDVTAETPVTLVVDVAIDGRSWQLTVDEASATHAVPLFGLRPDADLVVDVSLSDGARSGAADATLRVPPLPADLVVPVTEVFDPSRIEPGVTIAAYDGRLVAFDTDGVPCWYFPYAFFPVNELAVADGELRVLSGRDHLESFDLLGNRSWRIGTALDAEWRLQATDALALHHDFFPLSNGHFLVFSVERRLQPYPTSEIDELAPWSNQWVAGDLVVELAPDGSLARQIPLFDVLDPTRIGRDSVRGNFWFDFEPWQAEETRDWLHSNALSYDEATDTVVVSMRHQDAVVGLGLSTGELKWILGNPANWNPAFHDKILVPGPLADAAGWFWHQHSARLQADGTIALFDNHNYGAPAYWRPPSEDTEISRVLVYALDPEAGTFELTWSWGAELGLFAASYGDIDLLPATGNRLVTYGNVVRGRPGMSAAFYEVSADGERLSSSEIGGGATWYRTTRVTGLFPGPGR